MREPWSDNVPLAVDAHPSGAFDRSNNLLARGLVFATVLYVGPSIRDIAKDPRANQEWERSFRHHYSQGNDLKKICELREAYTRLLLQSLKKSGLADMQKFDRTLSGRGSLGTFCEETWFTRMPKKIDYDQFPKAAGQSESSPAASDRNSKLFLANNFTLGSAPWGTMAGDLLCRFWGTSIIVVLRPRQRLNYDKEFDIIGRAHLAGPPDWKEQKEDKTCCVMNLRLDILTLQELTYH
jgi:hypothetical protein